MAHEVSQFVKALLREPPKPPNHVHLEIDTDNDNTALFEFLLTTMTEILKLWYPPPITIGQISDEDLVRLIDYFASFGIQFRLSIANDNVSLGPIRNRDYLKKSRLEDMTFQMSHDGKRYTVRFSSL